MGKPDDSSSDVIEVGGGWQPPGWLARLQRALRANALEVTLVALGLGLVAGFLGGRLTAHDHHPARTSAPRSAPRAVSFTGSRCAVQVGQDIEVGIELQNSSAVPLVIRHVASVFPMGGLSQLEGGVGTCGSLPDLAAPITAIAPGASQWVTVRLGVHVDCPEAYPVAFRVRYARAGKPASTITVDGFPDLGAVAYRKCGHEGQGGSAGTGGLPLRMTVLPGNPG